MHGEVTVKREVQTLQLLIVAAADEFEEIMAVVVGPSLRESATH